MCGRAYSTYTDEEFEARYFTEKLKRSPLKGIRPNYNMAPTQIVPVVVVMDGKKTIKPMRWGLVPFWAKDVKSAAKYSLINAKGEEITEKRSYQNAFKKRRCILPLSGFFEWKRTEKSKRPFAIHLKDNDIMSVACVWERWLSKETGEEIDSFSIITTGANSFMEKIHDRMPVILDRKNEEMWLDPENQKTEDLQKLLKPCPSSWLECYEISTLVNSPKNNSKEVLVPKTN